MNHKMMRALGLVAIHLNAGRAIEPGSLVADAVLEAVEEHGEELERIADAQK